MVSVQNGIEDAVTARGAAMEGLSAGLAKQKFSEAIESLRKTDSRSARDGMEYALSGGLADAACGLMLLKTFDARKDQYDAVTRELEGTIRRMAEMPTTLEVSAYGYYLLGRCYAFLGIRKEKARSNFLRMTFRLTFRNELMEKAASLYMQSIARESGFVEAIFELGLVYDIGLNARTKAIEAYKIVTGLKPDHTLARGNLAGLYNETKQLAEAQAEAEELVRLSPTVISYGTLSSIYARQNKTEEAWMASRAARELPDQEGIQEGFSSHAYLLSTETLAPVPEPKPSVQPVLPQPSLRARFAR